jgi:hypothetical protein
MVVGNNDIVNEVVAPVVIVRRKVVEVDHHHEVEAEVKVRVKAKVEVEVRAKVKGIPLRSFCHIHSSYYIERNEADSHVISTRDVIYVVEVHHHRVVKVQCQRKMTQHYHHHQELLLLLLRLLVIPTHQNQHQLHQQRQQPQPPAAKEQGVGHVHHPQVDHHHLQKLN